MACIDLALRSSSSQSTMEVLKDDFQDIEIGSSVESLERLLESQRELFHSQIDQLQNIVVTQCKLTGVNPLAQEMVRLFLGKKFGIRVSVPC